VIVRAALAAALLLTGVAAAAADDRCVVPLADWQPRAVLQRKLEGEGWAIARIRSDDGCYEVRGRDPGGRPTKARFHPATLERVPHGHDHHGGGHDED
jgi:hypothetical protein